MVEERLIQSLVKIPGKDHAYPIFIGPGVFADIAICILQRPVVPKRILIITDTGVPLAYQSQLQSALIEAGFTIDIFAFEAGEAHKTFETIETMYQKALAFGMKRDDMVCALGGGIVGDMAGYFAATYLRGLPFIQVPTTLLAQVDSSVGGKVAVNWQGYKNMIGAFYHPEAVFIDTVTLESLPKREFACGMAEVIKYAFLEKSVPDVPLFESLWDVLRENQADFPPVLPSVIARCCELKASVVHADPEERKGIREILNLGHTFAHAFETLSHGEIAHGEAVSIGLLKAVNLSVSLGLFPDTIPAQLSALLQAFSLPTSIPEAFQPDDILGVMAYDKKAQASGGFRLVLPVDSVGKVEIRADVPKEEILKVL